MSQQSLPNRSTRNTNAPDGDFPHGVAYLDNLRVWFPRLSKQERARLERHGRDKLKIKKCRASIPSNWWPGWVVIVPRPTQSILRDLDALQFREGKYHGRISRLDVACDWPFLTQTAADAAKHYLHDHLLLPHRRKGPMQTFDSGMVAWLKYKIGRRPSKNLICYADKLSKIMKSSCCCHLEIRFFNARACRAAGLYRVGDLIELDPAQLFDRSIRLASHKDAKGPIQRFHDRYPRKTLIKTPLAVLNIPHVLLNEHIVHPVQHILHPIHTHNGVFVPDSPKHLHASYSHL
jgi:hypothetical protein